MTGATVINEDLGDDMDLIEVQHLGRAKKSISGQQDTIIQIEETPEASKRINQQVKKKIKY